MEVAEVWFGGYEVPKMLDGAINDEVAVHDSTISNNGKVLTGLHHTVCNCGKRTNVGSMEREGTGFLHRSPFTPSAMMLPVSRVFGICITHLMYSFQLHHLPFVFSARLPGHCHKL